MGEDGEVSLKHPEPEGEKTRGWWPPGTGAWVAILDSGVTGMDRGRLNGQESGPDHSGVA